MADADNQRQIAKVNEIYDSGTPLFTKDSIRQLADQVDKVEATGEPGPVYTTTLDGKAHEIQVLTGMPVEESESDEDTEREDDEQLWDYKCCTRKAYLEYRGLNKLIYVGNEEEDSPPQARFMTLGVENYTLPVCRIPIEQFRTAFQEIKARWDASSECKEFKSLMGTIQLPIITKIVAFGCGTLAHALDRPQNFDGAVTALEDNGATQHAFILTLRECLEEKQPGTAIECLAQDPGYLDADNQVLREAGIMPVEDPKGFLEVDDETIVFSQIPSAPVRQIIADIATPAMMIWKRVEPAGVPPRQWADESSPRVEKMVQDRYTEKEFIKLEKGKKTGFDYQTAIYVRND